MSRLKNLTFGTTSFTFVALALAVSTALAAAPAAPAAKSTVKSTVNAHANAHANANASAKKNLAKPAKPTTKLKLAPNDTVLYVGDLHCKHCAKNIASKLYAVKGVVKVRTDLKADVAIITPQTKKKLDPLALWKAAKTSGFPALKLVGPTGTYVADPKTKAAKLLPPKAPKKATATQGSASQG